LELSFETKKALAIANTTTKNTLNGWIKVGEVAQGKDSNGDLSFSFERTFCQHCYEFRAAIEDTASSNISYGDIFHFKQNLRPESIREPVRVASDIPILAPALMI